MINYNEEIQKFQPSLEVEEAQDAIFKSDITDIADVIEKLSLPKGARNQ